MSGRRRRSESLWDRKEEAGPETDISGKIPWQGKEFDSSFHGDGSPKRSNSETNDALMSGEQPSQEAMQGNENIPMDNDNNSDRHRMKMDPAFDEWENQYTSRPSDDCYHLPYRSGDRGVGGSGKMSKDRDRSRSRSWSPHRSRGRDRDRDRGSTRGLARSRSRSRSRGRGRSPFSDERRELYESGDVRNDSRVSSRPCKDFAVGSCRRGTQCRFLHQELVDSRGGGNRLDNDSTEKWSRQEYSGGSRFRDDKVSADRPRSKGGSDSYRKDTGRNEVARDDEYLCKDFLKGRCRRGGSCGFPHHISSSGDGYQRGNRNAIDDQDHRRQSTQSTREPCKFFSMGKCNRSNCKFSHDAPKSGGYEGRSHDNIQGHTSDDHSRPLNERQPHDHVTASGFSDFPNSNRNSSWNDLESGGFDDKNRRWDPPGWNESEKNCGILSQPRSVGNYMDMASNQESQIIHGTSQSDARSHYVMPETSVSQLTNATMTMMPEVPGIPCFQQHQKQGEGMDAHNMTNQQIHSYGSEFVQNMASQFPLTLNGTEKSSLNGPQLQSNGSAQAMFLHLDLQNQTEIQNKQGGKPLETSKNDTPQVSSLPVSLPEKLNLANALELLYSLPNTAGAMVDSMVAQQNLDTNSKFSVPMGILSNSTEPENQMSVEQVSSGDPNPRKLGAVDAKQDPVGNLEVNEKRMGENPKREQENTNPGKSEAQGKVEEGNDEKAMRQFKIALVEFVKEILKPTWKEGKMSREVYKTIVKKVVDKVTSTIQGNQIPRTQEKIDQYLAFSKSKITKLVEAYVGRFLKA